MSGLPQKARIAATAIVLGGAMGAAVAPPAGAAFTPARLVSGDDRLAADYALDPAFSADGRFVAYAGSQAGVPGVYRKDLSNGRLELVAGRGAGAPSVSADGRYVSFTTTVDLDAADTSGACESVYVRDMSLPAGAPGSFTLVSARDGASDSLAYADAATPGCPGGGSVAARGALSADGRTVVFTVVGRSDLVGTAGDVATPERQVAVRDLGTHRTVLVSQTRDSLGGSPVPVPEGATLALPAQKTLAGQPVSGSTATISADGTTVAWMGIQIPAQAPVGLFPERFEQSATYYSEPLWRRIADGPDAPTRRVVGGDDPEACATCSGLLDTLWADADPIDIPPAATRGTYIGFLAGGSFGSQLEPLTPRLSADGLRVVLLSNKPTYAESEQMGRFPITHTPTANPWVVDMRPGLTRAQAMRPLTSWGSFDFGPNNVARNAPVTGVAISPDGTRVAFTTKRIVFPMSPPALVTAPLAQIVGDELYQVNLDGGTLSLASVGYDGNPAAGDVIGLTYSGDSRTLAFGTTAPNLVYGAVNGVDSSAVLALSEIDTPAVPGQPTVTPPPRQAAPAPRWRIGATARRTRDGRLLVAVTVPSGGRIALAASAAVPVVVRASSSAAAGRKARRKASRPRRQRIRVVRRTVARAGTVAASGGVIQLKVAAARSYRALTRTRKGLDATLAVRFTSRGRAALRTTLPVRFRVVPTSRRAAVRSRPTRR